MKKITSILTALLLSSLSIAQSIDDPVILTIDNQSFTVSEFNYIYTKNQKVKKGEKDTLYKPASLDSYMELFIDYKLKVREAKRLGYDSIPRLQNELKQYRSQLSQPYMIDTSKNEALIEEAYNRTKNEIRASHILIRLAPEASPEDTLEAYNSILSLRKRIIDGEDFTKVAKGKGGSQDPSVATNGGDLGYFAALQMVYPFEDAAFKTNVGDISMPVRTQFGYHIIKVVDKREAIGKIETAHIMIMTDSKMSKSEVEDSKIKIDEIYDLLLKGEKFEDLAIKFSDDQSSKNKGGLLPAFGAGSKQRMVPAFEENAYALQNDGDYSKPFKTNYGWHIVKRISVTPIASYQEMYRELKLKVERDERALTTKQSFINTLKTEYKFSENKKLLESLNDVIDQSILQGKWKKLNEFKNSSETLFSFENKTFTLNDFATYLLNTQRREAPQNMAIYISKKYNDFVNNEVIKYEDTQLERKHPAFKKLIQEYQDGIYIFEIMQKQIWNKASKDSLGLRNYYDMHKSKFMYPIRYKGTLYSCINKSV